MYYPLTGTHTRLSLSSPFELELILMNNSSGIYTATHDLPPNGNGLYNIFFGFCFIKIRNETITTHPAEMMS